MLNIELQLISQHLAYDGSKKILIVFLKEKFANSYKYIYWTSLKYKQGLGMINIQDVLNSRK